MTLSRDLNEREYKSYKDLGKEHFRGNCKSKSPKIDRLADGEMTINKLGLQLS